MQRIVDLVGHQRNQLVEHPLVRRLTRQEPWDQVQAVVPLLAFWVSTHPDVLATCVEELRTPELVAWAQARHREATERAEAYPGDASRLGDPAPDPVALFGPAHAAVRRASYAIVGEAIHASSEPARLAVAWSVEVCWAVLAERAAQYRRWPGGTPRFLTAGAAPLPPPRAASPGEHREAVVAVERTFDAFRSLLDGIRTAARPAARLAG